MNKIKQQFSDLRKSTPRHIQWLLLAAAFIVVLILLTMLLGRRKTETIDTPDTPVLQLFATPATVDWADTTVGQKRSQTIKLSASAPTKILAVRRANENINGFSDPKQTCTKAAEISEQIPCAITLDFAPTAAFDTQSTALYIDYIGADEPETMKKTEKIVISLGAEQPFVEEVKAPAPANLVQNNEPVAATAPVIKNEIKREIELIAPSDPFADFNNDNSTTDNNADYDDSNDYFPAAETVQRTAESCSDFAFPGYNATGNQIGWIKPERGAYYFHPFSDKDCKNPTGIYNPDNGIITDIKDTGKKIGTDAEHMGYTTINNGTLPQLSDAPRRGNRARQLTTDELNANAATGGGMSVNGVAIQPGLTLNPAPQPDVVYSTSGDVVTNTVAYDRTFILRQYKPIPATIVSDVRADTTLISGEQFLPVRATVDRNVYSDNGRTVIIPTGTLLLGYVTGQVPGPYKSIGRMQIKWYQFVLPNGVEFNFNGTDDPFSGDSQGRVGVPGRGSTDYLEQFVLPMLTAIVPAAVNMIAPVADKFVNQIDLDNNTVVQSGTVRSSELAKNEIITAWNQVAQKLMVDMMDNTVPPFTIPAGTRITVYSPADLQVTCGTGDASKKCAVAEYSEGHRQKWKHDVTIDATDESWIGQVRSFNSQEYCTTDGNGLWTARDDCAAGKCGGYAYRTLLLYCQSLNYQAINMARQDQLYKNQQNAGNSNSIASLGGVGTTDYNEKVLGMQYADDDKTTLLNPFQPFPKEEAPATITCEDGSNPDANGCCTGEIYTDMGEQGFNCCPEGGGDCFPPIL